MNVEQLTAVNLDLAITDLLKLRSLAAKDANVFEALRQLAQRGTQLVACEPGHMNTKDGRSLVAVYKLTERYAKLLAAARAGEITAESARHGETIAIARS